MNTIQLALPLLQQLGTRSLAQEAVQISVNGMPRDALDRGWARVGSGMYRCALRGPDGLVYKHSGDFEMQVQEVRIFHRYAIEPWCPEASLHVVNMDARSTRQDAVVVMPYYPGVSAPYEAGRHELMGQISRQSGITDLCNSNVAIVDDQLIVIDAGNHFNHALPTDDQLLCPASCPCRVALAVPFH